MTTKNSFSRILRPKSLSFNAVGRKHRWLAPLLLLPLLLHSVLGGIDSNIIRSNAAAAPTKYNYNWKNNAPSHYCNKLRLSIQSRGGSTTTAPLLVVASSSSSSVSSFAHHLKVALAGGIAGAVGTAVLYPVDTAKTLRQANPIRYQSVRHALMDLMFPSTTAQLLLTSTNNIHQSIVPKLRRILRVQRAYRGVIPATLGAIPSSALYFGAYETMKTILAKFIPTTTFSSRLYIHASAAASGNALSSLIFVPKEFIKQQLQYSATTATMESMTIQSIITSTIKAHGIQGLYCGYQATLLRNVPSAILRFALYEEFKYKWTQHESNSHQSPPTTKTPFHGIPVLFMAGAVAGAIASGCMTPIDVIKTRLVTQTIPSQLGLVASIQYLVRTEGIQALYAGAPARMIWSGAFSAIGFGTFEFAKTVLGVQPCSSGSSLTNTTSGITFVPKKFQR